MFRVYPRGKKGTLWYDFRIDGERVRESAGTADRREAERIAKEAYKSRLNRPKEKAGFTFYSAVANWLKAKPRSEKRKTAARYLLAHYPDRMCHLCTDKSFRDAFADKEPATYNSYIYIARASLNLALHDGLIQRAPSIKNKTPPKRRLRFLTLQEWERLQAELPPHLLDIAEFSLATGLRQDNVLGLEWSQVDMARRVAWIHADQAKAGNVISVPLNDDAMTVLKRRQRLQEAHVFTYNGRRMKWITSGATTGDDGNRRPRGAWGKALARAKVENFRWHDIRHTWASWHVMNGTPLSVLKELGGWESIDMVQRYAHLAPEHIAKYAGNAMPVGTNQGTI
jgi:integrase